MTLGVLRQLAQNLNTDADADALVTYIYADGGHAQGARDFVDKYADTVVRSGVFSGTSCNRHGLVTLSPAAARLKSALQRRFWTAKADGEDNVFTPTLEYHITGSMRVARLILAGGFNVGDGTAGGYGAYFYSTREKAENYVPAGGRRPRGSVVLECSVFSRVQKAANYNENYGGGTWANNFMGQIVVVKNPLLIFPRAVFAP
jgi:hypothetical protein